MSLFDVFGPYPIQRENKLCKPTQNTIWEAADQQDPGLSGAIGCYLFCTRHGQTVTPWYVGMTVARAGFRGECFQPHKLGIYNECLRARYGAPALFLFPMLTANGQKFSRAYATAKPTISWLEKTLMFMAFAKNPKLRNIKAMKHLRIVEVPGLLGNLGPGQPTTKVQAVRNALLNF